MSAASAILIVPYELTATVSLGNTDCFATHALASRVELCQVSSRQEEWLSSTPGLDSSSLFQPKDIFTVTTYCTINMPYGRGGAGNIEAHEHDKVRVAADLEANHQAPKSSPETHVPLTDDERKYAHSGRGGSGNYYSPQELSQTGSFSDAHRSHVLGDGTLAPADATSMGNTDGAETSSYIAAQASVRPTRTVGRGGAGNFDFGAGVSEEKAARERMDEEQKRKRVQVEVEEKVRHALAEPARAMLTGEKAY